jgi:uncharacterized protein (TIGR03435 family)
MRFLALTVTLVTTVMAAASQTPAQKPQFDVASIKPSGPASPGPVWNIEPGGHFVASKITIRNLMVIAYRVHLAQILGGPSSIDSDKFDISAKSGTPPKGDELRLMIQSLLAERFGLVLKRETREMPVFALVIAKNGPKFHDAKDSDPNIIGPPLPAGSARPHTVRLYRGRYIAQGGRISLLTDRLTDILNRIVVDKTGLTGDYDMKLEWMPDENQVAGFQAMMVPEGRGAPPADWQGPTLFTALEEQLGLKLESAAKAPVEVLVIDSVQHPSEN